MKIPAKVAIKEDKNILNLTKHVVQKLQIQPGDMMEVVKTQNGFSAEVSTKGERGIRKEGKIPAGIVKQGDSLYLYLRQKLLNHLAVEDGDELLLDVISDILVVEKPNDNEAVFSGEQYG